jgi:hypothetical protein
MQLLQTYLTHTHISIVKPYHGKNGIEYTAQYTPFNNLAGLVHEHHDIWLELGPRNYTHILTHRRHYRIPKHERMNPRTHEPTNECTNVRMHERTKKDEEGKPQSHEIMKIDYYFSHTTTVFPRNISAAFRRLFLITFITFHITVWDRRHLSGYGCTLSVPSAVIIRRRVLMRHK